MCSFQVAAKRTTAEHLAIYSKPLEMKMRVKVQNAAQHKQLRFLTTPNYFRLIDEPFNILQLRIYLRKNNLEHESIDDVERIFLAGVHNFNHCYFDPASCIAINIGGKVELFFSYEEKIMMLREIPKDS